MRLYRTCFLFLLIHVYLYLFTQRKKMKNLHENLFRPRSRYEKNCGRVRWKELSHKQYFHNIFERTIAKLKATMQSFCRTCLLA